MSIASVSVNASDTPWLTATHNTTTLSLSINSTISEGNVTVTASLLGPYSLPTTVYYSYEVVSAVFLVKAFTFLTDKSSFDYDSFAYDLFHLMKVNMRALSATATSPLYRLDPNLLSFLTPSVAYQRQAMPLMVCNVDRSVFTGLVPQHDCLLRAFDLH